MVCDPFSKTTWLSHRKNHSSGTGACLTHARWYPSKLSNQTRVHRTDSARLRYLAEEKAIKVCYILYYRPCMVPQKMEPYLMQPFLTILLSQTYFTLKFNWHIGERYCFLVLYIQILGGNLSRMLVWGPLKIGGHRLQTPYIGKSATVVDAYRPV